MFSVQFHNAELAKLGFLKLIMNASLPVWGLSVIKAYLTLMDPVGQMVLNRDEINQDGFAQLCSCCKVSWASPAAAREKLLKWSNGWTCRYVTFQCGGLLGKEGGFVDECFRPLEKPPPKVILLK